ncbi:MAG: glycosyltransferase, partial [Nitrososphaeraceae archaeon]|nr:glycosyltransferase [Nitrososphaeraceae archaeon]
MSEHTARKILNLENNDNVLLFFGNIREYKGLDILLEAFDPAAEKDEKLKLVIAGLPYTKNLEMDYVNKIENLKYNNRIIHHLKFIPIEDVKIYFEASDLIILPYRNIYHSGIVHMAYSFGKPILTTRVGDFTEVIEEGKSGYLTDSLDPENISKWILKCF